jgi:hypothetical protein
MHGVGHSTRGLARVATVGVLIGLLAPAACTAPSIVPALAGPIPRCDDVPPIEAAPQLYRDEPIYVANEMPTDQVRAWASGKPGFESFWIDREHHGWITVAFSRDADARQAELTRAFPGAGVVAVGVDWTHAELEALQAKVMQEGRSDVVSSGIFETHGVVSVGLGVRQADKVARIGSKFGGLRVCIEGIEVADAPVEGPQQDKGEGWRLIANLDGTGQPYRTGIAADTESLAALWAQIGLPGDPPAVDFQSEVAIWFGAVHGSSCPRLRLDDVVLDADNAILYPEITSFEAGVCTADAIAHAYVVAVQRSKLPHGPFTIQLQSEEPPPGAVEEKTIVDADLSVPGSTVTPEQLPSAPPAVEESRVESGGYLEPGYPWRYRLRVHCGVEWLGKLNDTWWRADLGAGAGSFVPSQWEASVDVDGTIDLETLLTVEPEPRIDASAAGHTVTYHTSTQPAPVCR